MYLLDTNIWLERLLGQPKANQVGQLLGLISSDEIFITDFAFHSLCVILIRLKKQQALLNFVQDLFIDGDVSLVSIPPDKTPELVKTMRQHKLDFDDAYQYIAAKLHGLTLITFDKDLKRRPLGGRTPAQVIASLK
jgi:predicted nucleic acid-binding protein